MKLNLSALLLILGALGVFAPDVAAVAAWMTSLHVAWLVTPAKVVGFAATVLGSLPIAVPKFRALLSQVKLATAPGTVAGVPPELEPSKPKTTAGPNVAALIFFAFLPAVLYGSANCHNVKPGPFFGAVVDCAQVNPQSSAALAAVETCLISSVAGNPAACLSGLITAAHFTVDEVACLVAWIAQQNQVKVLAGTATSADLAKRQAANDWLAQQQISIRNSYSPAR